MIILINLLARNKSKINKKLYKMLVIVVLIRVNRSNLVLKTHHLSHKILKVFLILINSKIIFNLKQ